MSTETEMSFIHRFEPATASGSVPLVLLHGTGGDENDLLDLGRAVAPGSALLSPRGRVLENGMPRFFRRLAEGVFDEADVKRRASELADFISEAQARYGLEKPLALGFSNGANIAVATLLLRPDTFAGAVLLRPMMPLADMPDADLRGMNILMVSGAMDSIVPHANAARLAAALSERGASVAHEILPSGHQLGQADLRLARDFLARL